MSTLQPLKRMELREFWFRHLLAWQNSDLNQREYCEANDLPLKRFGNWRAELRHEMPPPPKRLLYRRGIRLRPRSGPRSGKDIEDSSPGYVAPPPPAVPQYRREFSPSDKRNIVAEIDRHGNTLSGVARDYGITPRLLRKWKKACEPEPDPIILPVMIVDDAGSVSGASSPTPVVTPEVSITLKSGHEMRLPVNTAPEMIQALLTGLDGVPS